MRAHFGALERLADELKAAFALRQVLNKGLPTKNNYHWDGVGPVGSTFLGENGEIGGGALCLRPCPKGVTFIEQTNKLVHTRQVVTAGEFLMSHEQATLEWRPSIPPPTGISLGTGHQKAMLNPPNSQTS